MEQLSIPTAPRVCSASPSPTRRPLQSIADHRMQRTPSLQTLHTVSKSSKHCSGHVCSGLLCCSVPSMILFHHIKQMLFLPQKGKAVGRKRLIYMSLNFQFRFEVPFTTYLPQWTKALKYYQPFCLIMGAQIMHFRLFSYTFCCSHSCPLCSCKSTLNRCKQLSVSDNHSVYLHNVYVWCQTHTCQFQRSVRTKKLCFQKPNW